MKKFVFLISFILVFILASCGSDTVSKDKDHSSESEPIEIFTTLYPLEFLVERIVGDTGEVTSILPTGADAHTYEPSVKTIVDIAESDAFIFIGHQMEPYAHSIEDTLKDEDVLLLSLGKYDQLFQDEIEHEEDGHGNETDEAHENEGDHEEGHQHGDQDPHFWLDPVRMIEAGEIITDRLSHKFPAYKDEYEKNFQELQSELEQLDQQFKELIQNKNRKTILVAHAAYGYWESRYGIQQLSVRGLSSSQEPSQKELEEMAREIQEKEITFMILEQNTDDRLTKMIAEELELDIIHLHNLSSLTDKELNQNKDYITIMKDNINVLDQALQ